MGRSDDLLAGVQQQERPGAIRALGLAGAEARLPEQRGLLIPERRTDPYSGQHLRGRREHPGRRADLRQHRARYVEGGEQAVVPLQRLDVHQHRPAGVRHVRHVQAALRTTGEVPDQPALHRAEQHLAPLRAGAQARRVVEHPAQPGRGEVRRQRQPAQIREPVRALVAGQFGDQPVGPGVLPDDGVADRLTGPAVPEQAGLPLVGDADGNDLGRLGGDLADRGRYHPGDVAPDLGGVVLDPAGPGKELPVLALGDRHQPPAPVEQDAPGRVRALVHRRHVLLSHPNPLARQHPWYRQYFAP